MYRGTVYRLGSTQVVASTTSAASTASGVTTGVHAVRIVSPNSCYIAFGASPTATSSDAYLPANEAEYFVVTPGQKVSAIRVSTSGNVYVTEVTGG